MFNGTHSKLLALLAFQTALGAWTHLGVDVGAPAGARPLLELKVEEVTALEIASKPLEDDEPSPVRFVRKGDGWVVASAGEFVAKTAKVEEVLGKVLGLKVQKPIATSKANHNALRVGARDYDKTVKIEAGGASYDLVMGSAKGSSIHVRKADSNEVHYARGLTTWALSDQVSGYVDTAYVEAPDVIEVHLRNQHGQLSLVKDEKGAWTLDPAPPGVPLKVTELKTFAEKAAKLTLADPVGKTVEEAHGLGENAVAVRLVSETKAEGEEEPKRSEVSYLLGVEEDGKVYAKASSSDYVVKVSKWSVEKILEAKFTDFVEDAEGEGQ
jgi:hypothetical protein